MRAEARIFAAYRSEWKPMSRLQLYCRLKAIKLPVSEGNMYEIPRQMVVRGDLLQAWADHTPWFAPRNLTGVVAMEIYLDSVEEGAPHQEVWDAVAHAWSAFVGTGERACAESRLVRRIRELTE